ncbi:MAG: FkbM family methyltransferase [Candidatus Binatia bacterium]
MRLKRFECPSDQAHSYFRYILGLHEPGTTAVVKRTLRAGMTVVDVGAHFGYFTVRFARKVGKSGRVYAFEPDPATFEFLERNTKRFENVACVKAAVVDCNSTVTLYRSKRSSHNSLWVRNTGESNGSVSVKAARLDEALEDIVADFVKIDTEGCELEVLDSMTGLLERSPTITLLVELNPLRMSGRDRSPDDLLDKLLRLGFEIGFVNEKTSKLEAIENNLANLKSYVDRHPDWNYFNILCTRPTPQCNDRRVAVQ